MKRLILKFGSISGLILVVIQIISAIIMNRSGGGFMSELMGYTTMVIALSIVFVGVKQYRDKHLGGSITFGQAFRMGLAMSMIASLFYVVGWMIISSTIVPDFMDKYAEYYMSELHEKGAAPDEITEAEQQMEYYRDIYDNPTLKAGITFLEILPPAIIMALLGALVLKRN